MDAKTWLDKAISRHERHMTGAEATSDASQRKMMSEMKKARKALVKCGRKGARK